MSWSYPAFFWGFLLLPLVLLAGWRAGRSARIHLRRMGGIGIQWQIRAYLRVLSMFGFTALAVLSLAEPRSGRRPVTGERSGLDVAVAFDVSRSMLSRDMEPSRLSRSTSALRQITANLDDARFSLIPFKGSASVSVPMTEDRAVLDMWIERLGPALSSGPGTDLEVALRTARSAFPAGSGRKRIVILISDGESPGGKIGRVVRELQDDGISVHVLAAGTADGGTIPLADGSLVLNESGHPVVTRADVRTLQELAVDTDGSYHGLDRPGAVAELISTVEDDREFAEARGIRFVSVHRYRMFLIPTVLMAFLYLFSRIIPWRRS